MRSFCFSARALIVVGAFTACTAGGPGPIAEDPLNEIASPQEGEKRDEKSDDTKGEGKTETKDSTPTEPAAPPPPDGG
jgi:hypothetical protein